MSRTKQTTKSLIANPTEAKRLFMVYTANPGRVNSLYGPVKTSCRAHIMSALKGETVSKSKAGWNTFRDAMIELYGATGDCIAAEDNDLARKAQLYNIAESARIAAL